MSKKEEPVDGTVEEWIPKTAHEVAVGMFHGLPNILVPARHHLTKIPGNEAKTVLKAVNRALAMVTECTAKFAKVPGPIRANFKDDEGNTVIIGSDTDRLVLHFGLKLQHRADTSKDWNMYKAYEEVKAWDLDGDDIREIMGTVARIAAGQSVTFDDAKSPE